jgi:hypothetical protein
MNTTTKRQRTRQLAVELEELGWRTALKLADLDRRDIATSRLREPIRRLSTREVPLPEDSMTSLAVARMSLLGPTPCQSSIL